MSPYATRRRAEQFAAVVDGSSARGAHNDRFDDLLQLVGAMRAVGAGGLDLVRVLCPADGCLGLPGEPGR